jgi:hypothetical protein
MAWAGWGAGPAGAGSSGGPSRAFLVVALVASLVVGGILARDGRFPQAAVAAAAAGYFALRLFGGLGRRRP